MKKTLTLLCFAFLLANSSSLLAQIPEFAAIPIDFEVTEPASIARSYPYSTMVDFGQALNETRTGELVWAYDDTDSLLCNSQVINNIDGKIAFIQRGICDFSYKIWKAQEAGAIGAVIVNHYDNDDETDETLVGMSGGDSAALVMIPAIFVSRTTGETIKSELNTGATVNISFTASFALNPMGPLAYGTPISQAQALSGIQFEVFNPNPDESVYDIAGTVTIEEPSGEMATLETMVDVIPPLNGAVFEFDDYAPTEIGNYTITYSNSLNEDILTRTFALTDKTFQADNGEIIPNTNGTIEPSEEDFFDASLIYHVGNFYQTADLGENPDVATHISFMISNPQELITGDDEADEFKVVVYDTDGDDDGEIDLAEGDTNLDGLMMAASGSHILSENDEAFEFITVALDNPLLLKSSHQYLVMVEYNGAFAAIGIPPKYAFAGNQTYTYYLEDGPVQGGDVRFTDRLYPLGWDGTDYNYVVRLHLDGFVGTKDVPTLAASKIQLAPNPANISTQISFDLEKVADEISIRLLDFSGRLLRTYQYEQVKNHSFDIGVKDLPAGTYFLSILTPEGYRAEKLVIAR